MPEPESSEKQTSSTRSKKKTKQKDIENEAKKNPES